MIRSGMRKGFSMSRRAWWLRLAFVASCGLLTIAVVAGAVLKRPGRRAIDTDRWSVALCHGHLHVARAVRVSRPPMSPWPSSSHIQEFMISNSLRECDPSWQNRPIFRRVRNSWGICLPMWPAAPVLIAIGVVARPRRQHRPGRCGTCGYDLTGLKGGVCPECGCAHDEGTDIR
jgi:hypothetical protein